MNKVVSPEEEVQLNGLQLEEEGCKSKEPDDFDADELVKFENFYALLSEIEKDIS